MKKNKLILISIILNLSCGSPLERNEELIVGNWYFIDSLGYNEIFFADDFFVRYNEEFKIYYPKNYLIIDDSIFVEKNNPFTGISHVFYATIVIESDTVIEFRDRIPVLRLIRLCDLEFGIDSIKNSLNYKQFLSEYRFRYFEIYKQNGLKFDSSLFYNEFPDIDSSQMIKRNPLNLVDIKYLEDYLDFISSN